MFPVPQIAPPHANRIEVNFPTPQVQQPAEQKISNPTSIAQVVVPIPKR